jgi:hypothetical protein
MSKMQRFDEGMHFRQVWPKKFTCHALGCISVSLNGAIGQKGGLQIFPTFWGAIEAI